VSRAGATGLVIDPVLHSPEYHGQNTMVLSDIAALTVSPGILQDMAAGHGPERSFFALGYAGWGPDQLENELADGAWFRGRAGRDPVVRLRHRDQMAARV
jgi:putative transcriptional regulator